MTDDLPNQPVQRLAVLGSPIAHSQSPALHRAAYAALGLDWRYDAIEVRAGELAAFLSGLGPEWRGLSLTMPLKHEVMPLLNGLDRMATITKAANTVLIAQTGTAQTGTAQTGIAQTGIGRTLTGFNTDVTGLVRALADAGVTRATHVTLLGAGATAASALLAAAELGAESVEVIVRTPSKAAPLVELGHSVGLVVTVANLTSLADPERRSDLVISTLPGGPVLAAEFPADLRSRAVLFDVSYSPWPSSLARAWAAAGGTVCSGLGMLLHQALIQVRVFVSGDPFEPLPREDEVLRAMRGALGEEPVKG